MGPARHVAGDTVFRLQAILLSPIVIEEVGFWMMQNAVWAFLCAAWRWESLMELKIECTCESVKMLYSCLGIVVKLLVRNETVLVGLDDREVDVDFGGSHSLCFGCVEWCKGGVGRNRNTFSTDGTSKMFNVDAVSALILERGIIQAGRNRQLDEGEKSCEDGGWIFHFILILSNMHSTSFCIFRRKTHVNRMSSNHSKLLVGYYYPVSVFENTNHVLLLFPRGRESLFV